MSGEIHAPGSQAGSHAGPAALVTPAQAAVLLDHVIYEQVLECVDVDALVALEQSLTLMLGEVDGVPCERARQLATSMLDRAILRLPDDVRRYMRAAHVLSFDGCELCEEEAAHHTGSSHGGPVTATGGDRRSKRPHS